MKKHALVFCALLAGCLKHESSKTSNQAAPVVEEHKSWQLNIESPIYLLHDLGDEESIVHIDESLLTPGYEQDEGDGLEQEMLNSILVKAAYSQEETTSLASRFKAISDRIAVVAIKDVETIKRMRAGSSSSSSLNSWSIKSFSFSRKSEMTDAEFQKQLAAYMARKKMWRDAWERIQKLGQKNPETYFFNRIAKKFQQNWKILNKESKSTDKPFSFGTSRLPEINYAKGEIPGVDIAYRNVLASKVFISVLPTIGTIRAFLKNSESLFSNLREVSIVGVLADFEKEFALGGAKFKEILQDAIEDPKLREAIEGALNQESANTLSALLQWARFRGKDRLHVEAEELLGASARINQSLGTDTAVIAHCKSGEGRSFTAVVTARVTKIIEDIKPELDKLSLADRKKAVDFIIDKETKSLKEIREKAKISPAKRVDLDQLAYEAAGVLPRTTKAAEPEMLISNSQLPLR